MSGSLSWRRLRKYVAALPALVFGFAASPAFSTVVTIDANGVNTGASSAGFIGATMTSQNGTFTKTTTVGNNPRTVIGVSGGFVANEVDINSESLTISFGSTGAVIDQITVGLLFLEGEWFGAADEAVQFQTNGGTACSLVFCVLSATGVWRNQLLGVTVLSSPVEGQGGIFQIATPFGSELISSIVISPFAVSGAGGANSDFGLVSLVYTTTAIPEPGTLALVALGTLGLGLAGGRRSRARRAAAASVQP
jgi:hypothetical protein